MNLNDEQKDLLVKKDSNDQMAIEVRDVADNDKALKDQDYFLFSCTILVEGIRKFADIPVYCERGKFPPRNDIFRYICSNFSIEMSQELFFNFSVTNIFRFANKDEFDLFTSSN